MDNSTIAARITEAVMSVARSRARYVEFAPGPFADAVDHAVANGFLDPVGNGVVQLPPAGRDLSLQKNPEVRVLNYPTAIAYSERRGCDCIIPDPH